MVVARRRSGSAQPFPLRSYPMASTDLQDTAEVFGSEEVMSPSYRLVRTVEGGVDCCHLYMQTFLRSTTDSSVWHSAPDDAWPLVATIRPDRLLLVPVYVNPH